MPGLRAVPRRAHRAARGDHGARPGASGPGRVARGGAGGAALVEGRAKPLINVFLGPAVQGPAGGPPAVTRQGYHLLHWMSPEYAYWVVSDLGIAELRDFAALLAHGDSAAATPARSAPAPP